MLTKTAKANAATLRTELARQSARPVRFVATALALLGLVLALSGVLHAQALPVAKLFSIFPLGGKQGTTVDVTIAGADLEGAAKLYFSTPGITAVQKTSPPGLGQTGPQPVPGQFTLTIPADAKPGICEVRAIGKYGVSNPRAFVVGTRDELVEKEPNNTAAQATELPLVSAAKCCQAGGETPVGGSDQLPYLELPVAFPC